jgi:Flp pilus assembly protein TadG
MLGVPRRSALDRSSSGQVLVIVAMGMIVFIAMVGLVIDGGNAWGQQRETQNGADAAAKAGATVIQGVYTDGDPSNDPTSGDVGCAVAAAADANRVTLEAAEYTDWQGSRMGVDVPPCAAGGGGAIPAGAQGLAAEAAQDFETYLMQVVGFSTLTARADATAVVGQTNDICPAEDGCGALPVTFPRTMDTCDGTNGRVVGEDEWEPLNEEEGDVLDSTTLVIVPLCTTGPGSVGWLDLGCGNLQEAVEEPCHGPIPIPAWLQTQTGNVNNLEDELQEYHGAQPGVAEDADQVLRIPIHDNTCRTDLDDDAPPADCPQGDWSGNGNNLYYHVPYWAGFKLDGAFVGGNDPQCDQAPGSPPAGGNGATGCLKGWFVSIIPAPGPITVGDLDPGDNAAVLGIVLVN